MSRRRRYRPYPTVPWGTAPRRAGGAPWRQPPDGEPAGDRPAVSCVLFDFGDTLFSHAPETEVIRDASRRLGAELSAAEAAELWAEIDAAAQDPEEVALGRDLDAAVWKARWRELYGLADRVLDGLGAAIDDAMHDPHAWVPYADTEPTLQALADAGVAVGVLSNTGWDIRGPFAVRGLDRLVGSFTLSCEAGAAKPEPEVFRTACASLDADPATTLMVGDNPVADGGAAAAGLQALILPAAPLGAPHGLASVLAMTVPAR